MDVVTVCTVLIIIFSITIVLGVVIAMLEPTKPKYKSVLSKKEYEKFLSQSKLASSVAHGGGKLCPDKEVFELIQEGSEHSSLKIPPLDI